MEKYKFIINKIQRCSVEMDFCPEKTIKDVLDIIQEMSEEELGFSEPEYNLECVTNQKTKISKILWTI